MAIIPTVRCSRLAASLHFYTQVLDFSVLECDDVSDPGVAVLERTGDVLILSSHQGDGAYGQAIVVMTQDIDELFAKFRARGLVEPDRDSPVHHGPADQTWGTRELYVDDPDRNTLRFTQRTE